MADFKPEKTGVGDTLLIVIILGFVVFFIGGAALEFLIPVFQLTMQGNIIGVVTLVVIVYIAYRIYADNKKRRG